MQVFSADTARPAVLVTGGAGFIGSHLVEALLARGDRVRVLDDLSSGRRRATSAHVALCVADLRDERALRRVLEGAATVYHLAALATVSGSLSDPQRTLSVNTAGTLQLLRCAAAAGVGRVIFASSAAVYGQSTALPLAEHRSLRPVSPYAVSKAAAEQLLAAFAHSGRLETVALRYFNVYGPQQDAATGAVIPQFCRALLAAEPCMLAGDGTQSRDFVYVDDVVQATLLAAQAPAVNGLAINVAHGEPLTLRELLAQLAQLSGRQPMVQAAPLPPAEIVHSLADISRARQLLGYRPQVTAAEGLARTLAWQAAQAVLR
jgi:UDP-glucose 4-epimerase